MNTEENKKSPNGTNEPSRFPEISGIELHYNSVNGLNVQNPNDILKATSDHTGSSENDVPGVSESPGASSINGMFPGGMIQEEAGWCRSFVDQVGSQAMSKLQEDFERELIFGTALPKEADGRWFDLTMRGKDLEFWEQLKIMPRFMILEIIVDPEMEYKFTIISEKGKNRVQYVLGKDLTHNQETILIERYTEALSEKIFGSKDKDTVQEIIDAQKLTNDMKAFGHFKKSMGVVESRKDSQISYGQGMVQGIQIKDPSTYLGGIDPIY